jgi:hypothetical protein
MVFGEFPLCKATIDDAECAAVTTGADHLGVGHVGKIKINKLASVAGPALLFFIYYADVIIIKICHHMFRRTAFRPD